MTYPNLSTTHCGAAAEMDCTPIGQTKIAARNRLWRFCSPSSKCTPWKLFSMSGKYSAKPRETVPVERHSDNPILTATD